MLLGSPLAFVPPDNMNNKQLACSDLFYSHNELVVQCEEFGFIVGWLALTCKKSSCFA